MVNSEENQGTIEPETEKSRHFVFDTWIGRWIVYRVPAACAWIWLILLPLKQRTLFGLDLSCHYLLLIPAIMWMIILIFGRVLRFFLYPIYVLFFPLAVIWLTRRIIAKIFSIPRRITRFASSSHFVLILVMVVCIGWILTFSAGVLPVRAIASLSAHTAMYALFLQSFRWAASPYKPLIGLLKWLGNQVRFFVEKTYIDPTTSRIRKQSGEVGASVCDGVLKVINLLYPERHPLDKGAIAFTRTYLVPLFILGFLGLYAILALSFGLTFYEYERAFGPQIEGLAESPTLVDYFYFSFLSQATAVPDGVRAISVFGQVWIAWMVMTGVLLITALITVFTTSVGIHAPSAFDNLQDFLLEERNRYTEWRRGRTGDIVPEIGTVIDGEFTHLELDTPHGKQPPVFYDAFDPFVGWQERWGGALSQSEEQKRVGLYSLKKSGARGDPSGGFKKIGDGFINRGFVLSGWLYRPPGSVNGPCDRLAIEDGGFNGYGFTVHHRDRVVWIELRQDGRPSAEPLSSKSPLDLPENQWFKDQWYRFEFSVRIDGRLEIHVYDSSENLIGSAGVSDDQYSLFDRVAVHGGSPYYVDDLRIDPL